MRIPTGNFGNVTLEVAPTPDFSAPTEALVRGTKQVADQVARNREAFQEAGAATAYSNYRSQLDDTATQLADDISTGKVSYDEANTEWEKRAAQVKPAAAQLDNRAAAMTQATLYQNAKDQARRALTPHIYAARQQAGVAQFDQFLDNQAKQAAKPGADVDAINASGEAYGAKAREYGIPEHIVAGKVQAFKDANWFNNAMQRAVEADGNLAGLHSVLHDLTDPKGMYADKLDAPKRAALQASVQNQIDHIELRAQAAADRREARAQRALVQVERQISSAIPSTADMRADWANTVHGTSAQADFDELMATEHEVQQTLKMPIGDQVRMVQEKEAALLQGGGAVAQGANVARLKNAVESNVKLLTQAPLVYGEERLGDKNVPLGLNDLTSDSGRAQAGVVLNERASRIRALSRQFQAPVPMRPLLPDEAKQLGGALQSASPQQAADLFGTLADAAGSPDIYRGMMQQIAPDSPVRASAGLLAQKQRELVMASHWYKPDETVASTDVAATMLEGDRLLNRSSTAKAEDGKAQTKLVLPETKLLQDRFAREVGTAFAGRPQAAEIAFQNAQAYYAGRVAQTGQIAKGTDDVDGNLVREAVRATLGGVVDFNSRGDVVAPWGMNDDDFKDRAFRALAAESKRRGNEWNDAQRSLVGLTNGPADGVYGVTIGQRLMLDDGGNPVLIDLRKGSGVARGYIERPQ